MKKILLFLTMLPLLASAQIGPIKTEENPIEFISGNELCRVKETDEYYLRVLSDNQFEDKLVILSLGVGPNEAMNSLSTLFAIFGSKDERFTIQDYTFTVNGNKITALHYGPIEYSAGNYVITVASLSTVMLDLIIKNNMPIGDVYITYFMPTAIMVHYDSYGFYKAVNLRNINVPYSTSYTGGDIITAADVNLLKDVASKPNAYRKQQDKAASISIDKNHFQRVCDLIMTK